MQNNPLVSIITPTYNHERYLADCIRSAQLQTFSDWEMIILDDGSSDSTFKIATSFAKTDLRIKVFQDVHKGIFKLSEIYNKGLQLSCGKYIAILEGDDLWMPKKLEEQVSEIENDDEIILVWSRANAKSPDLTKIYGVFPDMKFIESNNLSNQPIGDFLNVLLFIDPIPAVTLLIRRNALSSIGGFRQLSQFPTVDHPVLLELCKIGQFRFINSIHASWRSYASQTTKTYPVELWRGKWDMALNFYRELTDDIRSNINFTEKKLNRYYERYLLIAYARSGRYKLIRKDFSGARRDYEKAIFYKGFYHLLWRIRAIIGYITSLFKTDVEGLSRFLNRTSYTEK